MVMQFLDRDGLPSLAFTKVEGAGLTLVWLCGFGSDMTGGKATAVEDWAKANGVSSLRFDYRGCGVSKGDFLDGTIGRWRQDTLNMIDARTTGPLILIGSSMGGWIAQLVALARPDRVAGLILIAPATDFVVSAYDALPASAKRDLEEKGVWIRPSPYMDGGMPMTRALFEEGRDWCLMQNPIEIATPVRILHGVEDDAVAWEGSLELMKRLTSGDVQITFVKDGDHRLSRDSDIALLLSTIERLVGDIAPIR
jgi:pimeloyl-ACP methyl ester carboxylesterase